MKIDWYGRAGSGTQGWRARAILAIVGAAALVGSIAAAPRSTPAATRDQPEMREAATPAPAPGVAPAVANPRYGVIYARTLPSGERADAQAAFGAAAWLDMSAPPSPIGGKVPVLPLHPSSRLSGAALTELVAQYPSGTAWYIGGEANVPTQGNMPGAEYAPYFHDTAATIRAADPTARILAASVLNFVDTCRGCAGFTLGRQWIDDFRTTYIEQYGAEPPVDIWALDCYLLDWDQLPMIDQGFLPRQVTAFRAYLDAIPEQAGKPIWLTELGVIWAYDSLQWVETGGAWTIQPAGAFRQDMLEAWLAGTLSWLESDGVQLGVERWFLFASSAPPDEPWYHGIELLEPDAAGPRLTALGQLYADRARAPGLGSP